MPIKQPISSRVWHFISVNLADFSQEFVVIRSQSPLRLRLFLWPFDRTPVLISAHVYSHSFHFAFQSQPFSRAIPAILRYNLSHFMHQYGPYENAGTHGSCVHSRGMKAYIHDWLERTQEPCVPTCVRIARSISFFVGNGRYFRPKSAGTSPHFLVSHLMMRVWISCVRSQFSARSTI